MLQIDTTQHETDMTLRLFGDLDTGAAQELDERLDTLLPELKGDMRVDLSELSYLNSTGIRSFIRLDKLLKAQGRRLTFEGVNQRILRIFRYCGLDNYFVFLPEGTGVGGGR